jgi:hypothetical protein
MGRITEQLSPSITNLIRMDHAQVLASFHQYSLADSPGSRRALAQALCLSLEIHAQLMEEIFLPALHGVGRDRDVLAQSQDALHTIRAGVADLRSMQAMDALYEQSLMQMMRTALHYLADLETILLPDAELLLADRLGELGAQMLRRRLMLTAPRAGEIAYTTVRSLPTSTMLLAAGGLLAGGYLFKHRRGTQWHG